MSELLQIAINAAIEGGKEIMKIYATEFEVDYKGDDSPLTQADQNANAVINQHLLPTSIPIISEENKQTDYAVRKEWQRCWIVDPLDGTKEFVKRNGEFTVNIALVDDGVPVLGVIYVPVSKELYFNDLDGSAQKLLVDSDTISLDTAEVLAPKPNAVPVKIVGSRSHLNEATKNYMDSLNVDTKIVSKGSSLKFCLVAEGEAQVYPRFAPTMEWDTAAGHAICHAAGVSVIDQNTGEQLKYNKENLLNPYFLVKA